MSAPAIKHLDPVIGVDVHIIQPPGPVPPVPIPHPYVGIVFDPADYIPIIGSTISIHGMPRAIAGTAGKAVPSHIPIGGTFIKPPGNEDEDFMGSSTVQFDGDAATYGGLPALSCHDVGMIAPPRLNPKKKTKMKSLVLPTSVVTPIPAGPPVIIGGPPIISLMGMAMKFGMAGLGKALKRVAGSKLARKGMDAFKKARQKAFRNMKPGFLKCKVLRAEPVDVVTGEVVVDQQDYALPGRMPLEWNRHYGSRGTRRGVCGYGWETPADARLSFEADGTVVFHDGSGAPSYFPGLPTEGPVAEPVDGGVLSHAGDVYSVRLKAGLTYHFPIPPPGAAETLVAHVCDACDNRLTYLRDANGLSAIVDNAGRTIEVCSQAGLIREMRLRHAGEATTHPLIRYEYGEAGDLVAAVDALDHPYRFRYHNHRLIQHTSRTGLSFYYAFEAYTSGGRCVHTWGDGGLYDYRFAYFEDDKRTEITDSLGHRWAVEYDDRLLITTETDPLGGETVFQYDAAGRTTAVIDPDGNTTDYAYDERGNLTKLTRPDGKSIVTAFEGNDKPISIVDPNGGAWQQGWDARGLLVKQTTPLGAESAYAYDAHGQLLTHTGPRGAETALAYDDSGNVARIVDALGHVTRFDYDPLGNVTARIDALGHRTRYSFDSKGRLIEAVLPSGASILCGYDADDNLIRYQDENGAVTRLDYCGLGEIARRRQPDGHSVEYHYDTEEQLVAVTNQRGERYELRRDPLGRIVEEVDYWGQARRYAYRPSGHLERSVDPLGRVIDYEVDPLGRILKKILPHPDDPAARLAETFGYDANGNLVACENAAVRVERAFDAEGRMTEERLGDHSLVRNAYDKSGNRVARTTETTVGGATTTQTVTYRYDALDQAVGIEIPGHAPIALMRNAIGQLTEETLSEAVRRRLAYTPDGYLTAQQVASTAGPFFDQTYHYDAAGNLIEKRDSAFGVDRFTYDPMGRITEHLDPTAKLTRWLNDPAGDRLTTTVRAPPPGQAGDGTWSREGTYDGTDYRFDRAGNLVERAGADGRLTLAWDANNRLIRSTRHGVATEYGYDPLGRRVSKRTGEATTLFAWDGDALLGDAAVDGAGAAEAVRREWVYYPETFEPLALLRGGAPPADEALAPPTRPPDLYLYHNDPNGCPTRLLNPNGDVVWAADYSAWGNVERLHANRVDNPLRLQGQYWDSETHVYFNRNRYFCPITGLFLSSDPLGLSVGINLYRYGPNTYSWIDPLGLDCSFRMQPYRYSDVRVKGPHGDVLNNKGLKVTEGRLVISGENLEWKRFGDMGKATQKDLKEADRLLRNLTSDDAVMSQARGQVDLVIKDLERDLSHKNKKTRELAARQIEYFRKMRGMF